MQKERERKGREESLKGGSRREVEREGLGIFFFLRMRFLRQGGVGQGRAEFPAQHLHLGKDRSTEPRERQ